MLDPVGAIAKATEEVAKTIGKGVDLVKSSGGFVGEFIRSPLTEWFGIQTVAADRKLSHL
jgi:hypothetical protein